MGIQFSDIVENIAGKGEIARYEQFLLFPQCFQRLSVFDAFKRSLWSKGLMPWRKETPIKKFLGNTKSFSFMFTECFYPFKDKSNILNQVQQIAIYKSLCLEVSEILSYGIQC